MKQPPPLKPVTGKAQILKSKGARIAVDVPEWDCRIWLRAITMNEQKKFESWSKEGKEPFDILMRLLIMTVVDKDGRQIFTDDDISELSDMPGSAPVCLRLAEKAMQVNGLSEGDLEDIRSDFPKTKKNGSASGSPSRSAVPSRN